MHGSSCRPPSSCWQHVATRIQHREAKDPMRQSRAAATAPSQQQLVIKLCRLEEKQRSIDLKHRIRCLPAASVKCHANSGGLAPTGPGSSNKTREAGTRPSRQQAQQGGPQVGTMAPPWLSAMRPPAGCACGGYHTTPAAFHWRKAAGSNQTICVEQQMPAGSS